MKILAEKNYSYVLMDNGRDWILTFLSGGVAEHDVSIRLNGEEIAKIRKDAAYLDTLIEYAKNHRSEFVEREIMPAIWPKRD